MKDKLQQWLKDVNYDHKFIWSDDGYMIAEIRGWGMLQHMFPTSDGASDFQDKVGKFIAEAINEKIERLNQKQHIIDIMEADEKDGLYNENNL